MQSAIIRGDLAAVAAVVFAIGYGFAPDVKAQQAAAVTPLALTAKGAWSASVNYVKDDIVTARGSSWRAKRANINKVPGQTSPSTAADWEQFAAGFNPLGAWSSVTKYQPNDLVTYLGATWRAKITSTNVTPNNHAGYWEAFAAKGATGPAGPNTGIGTGSQSVPAISFNGDANTGIYSPDDGKIALVENGVRFLHNIGINNTALGLSALASNTGVQNTAVGESALQSNTSGLQNTAVGYRALKSNTSGAQNTAVGATALQNNTSGGFNVAVGFGALVGNTSGGSNAALGFNTLQNNNTGNQNIAVGNNALLNNTTGGQNAALGHSALFSNIDGISNIAVGRSALQNNNTGSSNTAVGHNALLSNTTGNSNIAVGVQAGSNASSSNNGIFIGNTGTPADTTTIKIGTQGTQTKTFIAGISGVTTDVNDAVAVMVDSSGQLGVTSSSRRYKYDIETMADVSAMLTKLRPVTFRYKQAQNNGAHPLQYGLIAEEVADVFPGLAVFNKDGSAETVKYHLLPSFLLAGWQAQQKTIAAQTQKIEALEERLRRLEALLPQTKAAALR